MKHLLSTLIVSSVMTLSLSSASFADDKPAKPAAAAATTSTTQAAETPYTVRANSTGQVQRAFVGTHIDNLPDVEESTKAVDDPNRIVCKKIAKLGSRLRKRKVCATKKEWDMMKTNSVNTVRQMQNTRNAVD